MDVYEVAREFGKAAGVYEFFKDETKHKKISAICNKDSNCACLVKRALMLILVNDGNLTVENGLAMLSSSASLLKWKDLSKDAKESFRIIALAHPELIKKSASSVATTSTSATINTSNTGEFDGSVTVEDVLPAAFQVVLGAAHKKAIARGLEKPQFENEFETLFWTDSKEYKEAYNAVVLKKPREKPLTMSQRVWDLTEKVIAAVNLIDVASQNRADSTEQSDFDHLYEAAMEAFSKFVKNDDVAFSKQQIGDLLNLVLQPTSNF